ncbi:MAG: single-stranded-DNA-specific exonuclease RecJ, partial [Chloroflexota bacterium]
MPEYLPPAVARVLVNRGIDTAAKLQLFLHPPHRLPYDPVRLPGMDQALQRLHQAVNRGEKVGIFGDFDVDGVTGTAIVAEGLRGMGLPVFPYLPHRVNEGHGLSVVAIQRLVEQGVSLIITVDCGTTAVAEVAGARELGADVIITDHHVPHDRLPEAAAVVNPRLPESNYPFLGLSGAGLGFKLVQGLYQFYGQPWDPSLLELAALGTIADLVPLVDENRFLVQQGLAALAQTGRPGLQALYRRAGVQPSAAGGLSAETVAFQIAPRLNSPGRMEHAGDSYRLLTTQSQEEAEVLAEKLERLNQERRNLTEEAFAVARQQVLQHSTLPPILLVADPSFVPGITGVVAGRLVETFRRPAVVMALGDDRAMASGRSIPEFNIIEAFTACGHLLTRYGGHAQAAGFTLPAKNLPLLEAELTAIAQEALGSRDLRPTLSIDAEVKIADLLGEPLSWLSSLEPFGMANPRPVFLTRRAQVLEAQGVGKSGQHLKLRVREGDSPDAPSAGGAFGQYTALAFNQAHRWVANTPYLDLVYTLSAPTSRGDGDLTLKVLDFRPS